MDELKVLREKIRALDDQLFGLVAERLTLARAIGARKLAQNLPIKDFRVEKEVLSGNLSRAKKLGIYPELADQLTKMLIRFSVETQDEFASRQKVMRHGQRVVVVGGRGLMGGWISSFFDSFGAGVSHVDAHVLTEDAETQSYPLIKDLATAVRDADVVILSTPISATAAIIDQLTVLAPAALIFDICSLKSPLLSAIKRAANAGLKITSVHPMFGPSAGTLSGRNILVCHAGNHEATAAARALFQETTARLTEIALEEHDRLMGAVLGLSHLTNLVFASALSESDLSLKALRDAASTTFNAQLGVALPVTAENADLYFEIQAANAHTPKVLEGFREALESYATAIASGDRDRFTALMAKSQRFLHGDPA